MTDHVCIRTLDGEPMLVAIETPLNQDRHYAPVEQPISAELLGKYFVYDAEKHEYKRSDKEIPSIVKKEKIREHLYLHGFDIDGIHYVRYKRSAGSSRDGRCLFIAEPLFPSPSITLSSNMKSKDGDTFSTDRRLPMLK